mmetsp:Transcript_834/g.1165  ORF Transcript_834/g.1165 Transcript_834/m.1165 type:complete len:91 (-) Transcript_834:340-612(-)
MVENPAGGNKSLPVSSAPKLVVSRKQFDLNSTPLARVHFSVVHRSIRYSQLETSPLKQGCAIFVEHLIQSRDIRYIPRRNICVDMAKGRP